MREAISLFDSADITINNNVVVSRGPREPLAIDRESTANIVDSTVMKPKIQND